MPAKIRVPSRLVATARKLIALRDRASTDGEATAAARVLSVFIDKHRISISELEEKSGNREECSMDDKDPLLTFRNLLPWRRSLCGTLCDHYGVAWWQRRTWQGRDGRGAVYQRAIYLCGRASDIALVRHTYAWLDLEATRLASKLSPGGGRSAKKSFLLGFVAGIREQLAKGRVTIGVAGLVLRDRLKHATEFLDAHMNLKTISYRAHRFDQSAFEKGKRNGRDLHLGKRIEPGGARVLQSAAQKREE